MTMQLAGSPAPAPHARLVSTSSKANKNDVHWGKVPVWMKRTINAINRSESRAYKKAWREAFKADLANDRARMLAGIPLTEDNYSDSALRLKFPEPIKEVLHYNFCDHYGTVKENGEEVFVTHPYLGDSQIENLKEFCARTGFVYELGGVNYYHLANKHVNSTTRLTIRRGLTAST